jgi:hypothetical protein
MNTPFDFMSTPYLYMNACFLKMRVVDFIKINVAFRRKGAGRISDSKRVDLFFIDFGRAAARTKKASIWRLFLWLASGYARFACRLIPHALTRISVRGFAAPLLSLSL